MPPKKRSGSKKSKKAKKVKYVPDPDEQYRKTLEEQMYIPKATRDATRVKRCQALSDSIAAVCATGKGDALNMAAIPLARLPDIVRSVGLDPTKEQLSMMEVMVCDNYGEAGDQFSALRLINYDKLEKVVLDILATRILAYDPQVLTAPHPAFPTRVSSVVVMQDEARLRAAFESLWKASGSRFTGSSGETRMRCIDVSDLKDALRAPDIKRTEVDFTPQEMEDFLFTFQESGSDVVREDAFLLSFLDV